MQSNFDKKRVLSLVNDNRYSNVYLYIDFMNCDCDGQNIACFVDSLDNPSIVLFDYYQSIQLMVLSETSDNTIQEIVGYIQRHSIKRISGPTPIVNILSQYLPNFRITNGHIMSYESFIPVDDSFVEFAKVEDLEEITSIICSNEHLGKSYTYDSLYQQLKNRMINENCESFIIRKDDKIASHFAVYALSDKLAVLSGMITRDECRGRGYGRILVNSLSNHMLAKGITPIIYCYEEEYFTWYQKLGYKVIGTSSKLEKTD